MNVDGLTEGYILINKYGHFWGTAKKTLDGIETERAWHEFTATAGAPYKIIKFKQEPESET